MQTALFDQHLKLNAKIINFSGWELPIYYTSIMEEHHCVRQRVGVFDVSHMGRISIKGFDAESFLDFLATNKIKGKKDLTCTYTTMLNEKGYCVDDTIVYKHHEDHFSIVANASNKKKDLNHLKSWSKDYRVTIEPCYDKEGILAVQGPNSLELLSELFCNISEIKPMRFIETDFNGKKCMLSRTGYTGERGFEIYASNGIIEELFVSILKEGEKFNIQPIGLGARDTLRLEVGFALYGHELSESIYPQESVSSWTVKMDKNDFVGKNALKNVSDFREQLPFIVLDRGIARENVRVLKDGKDIGYVTSGTQSPTLKKAIGIAMVKKVGLKPENEIEVIVRDRPLKAKITTLPFIEK